MSFLARLCDIATLSEEDMKVNISQLKSADLGTVDMLMKRYSQTLGFLPMQALESYLEKGTVLGAKTEAGKLAGYLLYAAYPNYFRITHLCVSEEYQGQGIAKDLVNTLKMSADTQKVIKLHCRRDFPANNLWPKLGFVALGEKRSRSKEEHWLTIWHFRLAPEDQLELFQAATSDDTLDIIIDAQIFFDFDEPESDKAQPSKALLSDFLVDTLNLWITDELLNEINRQKDHEKRENSRRRTHRFPKVACPPHLVEAFERRLRGLLPERKASQGSDIRQLARAAASPIKTFVTKDHALLEKAEKIGELTGLEVINPVDLIVRLHELSGNQTYAPDYIAGLNLRWARLASNELTSLRLEAFLKPQETKGKFREKLESLVAQVNRYECELLRSGDKVIAIRVLTVGSNKVLTAPLARVAHSADQVLFGRFLIADAISKAVEENLDLVRFETAELTPNLMPYLLEMGFIAGNGSFVRFCFSRCLRREEVLAAISESCPESVSRYQEMSPRELERCCSPLVLEPTEQECFLIPIRPFYATGLIDRHQSGAELFGGNPNVLLRWDNVYYRAANRHKMLKPPARILWYVSSPRQQVIAVSCLDDVLIDTTKELFRQFRKFGILEWRDLFKMCNRDPFKQLMVLKFSHTFLFRKPVSLATMREIGISHPQGPMKISPELLHQLLQRGYPNQ